MSDDGGRRMARVVLAEEALLEVLNGIAEWQYVDLPGLTRFPPGTRVVAVHADFHYRGIVLVLESPAFDLVPSGCEIPLLNPPLTANHLVFRRLEDTHEHVGGEDTRGETWRDKPPLL